MPLFKEKTKEKLELVKESPFKLEKELQKLTEKNLNDLFGLEFVSTEFEHNGLRIDTLSYDPAVNAFVVIEYKRDKSFSVIDQGFAYLSLILNNQAEFVLEYNRCFQKKKDKKDFDWSQTRVMFLMRSFTTHQLEAINFRDLPIELWEVTRYEGGNVQFNQIKRSGAKASIDTLGISNKEVGKISREVKNYTEDGYIESRPDGKGRMLYRYLKERLDSLDPTLEIHPTKYYLAFRSPNNWRNIFNVFIHKEYLLIELTRSQPQDYKDPENKIRYKKDSFKQFHQHISALETSNAKEIDYAVYVIQQALVRIQNNGG